VFESAPATAPAAPGWPNLCTRSDSASYNRSGYDRFAPKSIRPPKTGIRPSVNAILDLVDTSDPAWSSIAVVLQEFRAAGIDLDATSVAMAVRLGRHRHDFPPVPDVARLRSTAANGPIVYYIRRANLIKIGTTTDPHARFLDLMPDQILAVEPGDRALELLGTASSPTCAPAPVVNTSSPAGMVWCRQRRPPNWWA